MRKEINNPNFICKVLFHDWRYFDERHKVEITNGNNSIPLKQVNISMRQCDRCGLLQCHTLPTYGNSWTNPVKVEFDINDKIILKEIL